MQRSREEGERLRAIGRLAGASFIVTPLVAISMYVVMGSDDIGALIPLAIVAIVAGVVVLSTPFARGPDWWIVCALVVAIGLCTWGCAVSGEFAAAALWPFLVVAAFIALTIERVSWLVALVALACVGMVAGLVISGAGGPSQASTALAIPALVGITAILAATRRRERGHAERLRVLALVDALTEVGNRRLLSERLDYELRRHRRTGLPMGLFIVDLNGFKAVNDRAGHAAGDAVLREAAAALVGVVRASDTVVRYGGDEFAVLAPELDERGAHRLATGITEALGSVVAVGRPLTGSVGWALYPGDAGDAAGLVAAADARERRAKADTRES